MVTPRGTAHHIIGVRATEVSTYGTHDRGAVEVDFYVAAHLLALPLMAILNEGVQVDFGFTLGHL